MYPFQLDRITRPALLHWELFSGRCEFLLEEAHPSDVATGPITARDEDELGDVSLLRCMSLQLACAVKRRRFPVGANPTRQTLQPEATGAAMEVTKWLKPSDSVSRYTVTARVCRP